MNILITGGAGFIGSYLCEYFLKRGDKVFCVDNLITSTKDNIKWCLEQSSFKFIYHDISKPLQIDEDLDWILHFASPASPRDYLKYPIQTLKVGALGTHNCLGLAKLKKACFMLASTSEVYGDPQIHPQPESYLGRVNCIGPRGVYDEAKRFAEALAVAYHKEHGIDIRIARIFNTYGPRMRIDDGRVIPNFITQALKGEDITVYGDGTQTRSFCYITDLIEGIVGLMNCNYHMPVNLGNPAEIKIIDLANKIVKLTNSSSCIKFMRLPEDDPKMRCPDISVAKEKLHWFPKVNLDEGLKHTIEYFRRRLNL